MQSQFIVEVSAIESEHSKNLQSDFWRYEQLFKLRADPAHPYSKCNLNISIEFNSIGYSDSQRRYNLQFNSIG